MRVPSGFDGRGACRRLWLATLKLVACGGRSVGNPDFGCALLVARCLRTWRRQGAAGDGLHPRPSAPGGTHTGRVWSSSSSVARDPEISSTWLAKCRQSRHARLPHGSWGMLLGALASSPSPAKVEASHRQVGPVPRFLLLGSQLVLRPESSWPTGACLGVLAAVRLPRRSNASWDGGRWLVCSGIADNIPASRFSRRPKRAPALAAVGFLCCIPIAKAFHCPERPVFALRCTLGAAARGGPQGARCVPRPAHGRTCPGRWPIASSPDLSDAEHTVGTRPRPLFAPKASVRRFVRTTPATVLGSSHAGGGVGEECYLVDPASSHMLVSKIKPCMWMHLLDKRSTRAPPVAAMIHDNSTDRTALVPATHHSNFCPINFRWVRFRRGSLRNGYHIQGRQQARKLPNPDTGRIHWRASLVPAAAVIPAPIAWTLGWAGRSASGVHRSSRPFCRRCAPGLNWPGRASGAVTLKKLECSKQAYALYTLAWDNIIGFRSYYVGLRDRKRKLGARRRSDTVLVSTINDADQGSADVAFRTPPAPYEKSKSLGSGGSMVARLKLKGIDGRAPPGVEPAA
ncbi:UNVERIFIED_CONTAM: hypothetical protein Sindi_2915200 [Sesamum indicum]